MPKIVKELSDIQVRRLRWGVVKQRERARVDRLGAPCTAYHAVGGVAGLLLQCSPPSANNDVGARSWILRTMVGDKRRDIGLGGYPDVSLATARQRARELKEQIRQGIDPIVARKAAKSALAREQARVVTFAQLAAEYIDKKSKELKTARQVQKLTHHLATYAYPHLGQLVIADIERLHIEQVLKPIWESKTETANRVRQAIENILDLGAVKGLRSGYNPARWKGNLELTFPARTKIARVQHHAALPVPELPAFMAKLGGQTSRGAKALQFGILTAARSAEIRGAQWSEIDTEQRLWTIPGERMKSGRPHRVPLSQGAMDLLASIPRTTALVFPNRDGRALSDVLISKVPKRLGWNVTAHGFRATFRTWAQEQTDYPEEVVELALAHVNSDATRAAYARSELLDKRRALMADWDRFCFSGTSKRAKPASRMEPAAS
jgi:integrase